MIDADLKDDAAELDRTLAPDYVIVRDNGVVRSRAETLEGIKSGATKFTAFDLSDVQVRFYGRHCGGHIPRGYSWQPCRQGYERSVSRGARFVNHGGSWQSVLAQRTRISGI